VRFETVFLERDTEIFFEIAIAKWHALGENASVIMLRDKREAVDGAALAHNTGALVIDVPLEKTRRQAGALKDTIVQAVKRAHIRRYRPPTSSFRTLRARPADGTAQKERFRRPCGRYNERYR
jgi:hypothetical protein